MRFYDNEILAIFKNLLEFKVTVIILLLGLNHLPYLRRKSLPLGKIEATLLAGYLLTYINLKISKFFLRLRSKLLVPLLVAFVLVILWRWPLVTVFENFLEKRKIFRQKNYTTFVDSL